LKTNAIELAPSCEALDADCFSSKFGSTTLSAELGPEGWGRSGRSVVIDRLPNDVEGAPGIARG